MTLSPKGLAFIKEAEGYVSYIYSDNGNPCIGWGCNLTKSEVEAYRIYNPKNPIPESAAEFLLGKRVSTAERGVLAALENVVLTQNQFDALVSLCFNIGSYAFMHGNRDAPKTQLSTIVRFLRNGDTMGAALHFLDFKRSNGAISPSLLARRAKEKAIFEEEG